MTLTKWECYRYEVKKRKREDYESWMRSKACKQMVSQHEPFRIQADGGLNIPQRRGMFNSYLVTYLNTQEYNS